MSEIAEYIEKSHGECRLFLEGEIKRSLTLEECALVGVAFSMGLKAAGRFHAALLEGVEE